MKGLKPIKEAIIVQPDDDVNLWPPSSDIHVNTMQSTSREAAATAAAATTTTTARISSGCVVCPSTAEALNKIKAKNKGKGKGKDKDKGKAKDIDIEKQQKKNKRNVSATSTANSLTGCASGTALITAVPEADEADQPDEVKEPARGNWTGRFDFLLSLLGYSVGLGNVWRFPYLCYANGGGAFLIPFSIMLVIAGLPLMFMELSFGQYAALGPIAIYQRFCPLFRGLGTGMVIVSAIVMLYYNVIIAWTIFYMFGSFRQQLPWQNCDSEWSTVNCFSYAMADQCEANNGTYYLRTCYNASYAEEHNITEMALHALKRPPAEEYFNNFVLGLSAGIEETGNIKMSLAACLLIAWIIVFLCLCKGVKSSGKVVYFTALFPYVVLVVLFIRGVTLPGASTGILFYLTPDFMQLANAQVWGDAAVQIFFALSPAWGGLITLSSYNRFSNNCYKDSLIVAFCNIATSFFAGLVIFSIIGFLANELDVEVEKVVDQGAGLAFIVYPEVVTRLPISPVWSVLFFVMLLTLGLDSQFALMETVTTAILDKFPTSRQYKTWVVLFVGIFGYLGGLGFTTNSGMYWLQLMDKYAANWSVLLIAISECLIIAWCYGSERFLNDIQGMIGKRSKYWVLFWSIMWRFITPAALIFILFFSWVEYKPAKYGHYVYPGWADTIGWITGILPVLVILTTAAQQMINGPKHMKLKERFKYLLRPSAEWGPAGQPCVNLHTKRYDNDNYGDNDNDGDGNGDNDVDDRANTQILIENIQSDIADEGLQLMNVVDNTQLQAIATQPPVTATVSKVPGPSILKLSKQTNNQEQAMTIHNGENNSNGRAPISLTNTITGTTTTTATNVSTVVVVGTMSSGRECQAMTTFSTTPEMIKMEEKKLNMKPTVGIAKPSNSTESIPAQSISLDFNGKLKANYQTTATAVNSSNPLEGNTITATTTTTIDQKQTTTSNGTKESDPKKTAKNSIGNLALADNPKSPLTLDEPKKKVQTKDATKINSKPLSTTVDFKQSKITASSVQPDSVRILKSTLPSTVVDVQKIKIQPESIKTDSVSNSKSLQTTMGNTNATATGKTKPSLNLDSEPKNATNSEITIAKHLQSSFTTSSANDDDRKKKAAAQLKQSSSKSTTKITPTTTEVKSAPKPNSTVNPKAVPILSDQKPKTKATTAIPNNDTGIPSKPTSTAAANTRINSAVESKQKASTKGTKNPEENPAKSTGGKSTLKK